MIVLKVTNAYRIKDILVVRLRNLPSKGTDAARTSETGR